MAPSVVEATVPAVLLLDRGMTASDKLLWIAFDLFFRAAPGRVSYRQLSACTGLSPKTIGRSLARWENVGGLPSYPRGSRTALLPAELVRSRSCGPQAKLLYGIAQLMPGFGNWQGQTSYRELAGLSGLSLNSVRTASDALQRTGWLFISRENKYCPLNYRLHRPGKKRWTAETVDARLRLEESYFRGEAIMREYLTLLVDDEQFEDNATPGFLLNPFTGEELQFDRYYYSAKVAFEFHGAQHFGPTKRFPSEMKARRQQGRDLIKMGHCLNQGIALVVLQAEDLQLERIRGKVTGLLPLRNLEGHEPLTKYLEAVSRGYRQNAQQEAEVKAGVAQVMVGPRSAPQGG